MTTPVPEQPVPFDPVEIPSKYAKALVAIVTAGITMLAAALTDNDVSDLELANIAVAILTAVGVYLVPNLPDTGARRWTKGIVAVVGTGLQALVPFLVEGEVTTSGWLLVLVAALGAVGVGVVPNTKPVPPTVVSTGTTHLHLGNPAEVRINPSRED